MSKLRGYQIVQCVFDQAMEELSQNAGESEMVDYINGMTNTEFLELIGRATAWIQSEVTGGLE